MSVFKQIHIGKEGFITVPNLGINFYIISGFFPPKAPKRRRPARSIFDGFRDFQTETSRYLLPVYYLSIFFLLPAFSPT